MTSLSTPSIWVMVCPLPTPLPESIGRSGLPHCGRKEADPVYVGLRSWLHFVRVACYVCLCLFLCRPFLNSVHAEAETIAAITNAIQFVPGRGPADGVVTADIVKIIEIGTTDASRAEIGWLECSCKQGKHMQEKQLSYFLIRSYLTITVFKCLNSKPYCQIN